MVLLRCRDRSPSGVAEVAQAAYAADEIHARFVATWLAPRIAAREAWTFHADP